MCAGADKTAQEQADDAAEPRPLPSTKTDEASVSESETLLERVVDFMDTYIEK